MDRKTPAFNLKAVARETGLAPATLRAWERRYGLLHPQRSAGGHRLYSLEEIELLKWLVARQSEGLSISHAAQLWRSQAIWPAASGQANLDTGASGAAIDRLRREWSAACLAFDEPGAELALSQALAVAGPEVVCAAVLQKGLAELGAGWYEGRVSIQQEHFASALAARRLHALSAAAPAPSRSGKLLAACPPGEMHELPLLMLTFLLRWHGWEVIYLGADVPLARLDATLQATSPVLALSAAQTLPGAAALNDLADCLNTQSVPLAFGGGVFQRIPTLAGRISGHFLGGELSAVPEVVARLLSRRQTCVERPPLPAGYETALTVFRDRQVLIVKSVSRVLEKDGMDLRHVEEANVNFSRSILAALSMGDVALLDFSTAWLNGLLENYGLPTSLAGRYYRAFHQAVAEQIGGQAAPLLTWFARMQESS